MKRFLMPRAVLPEKAVVNVVFPSVEFSIACLCNECAPLSFAANNAVPIWTACAPAANAVV